MIPPPTPECFANHMGALACLPSFVRETLSLIQAGLFVPPVQAAIRDGGGEGGGYDVTPGGVAIVSIVGPMMKGQSKYGGTSTVATRRALRAAAADARVGAIALRIDSPGGYISGTQDLADEVADVAARKPLEAYIEDLGASAAYWVASRAGKISANASAQVGSIGGYTVLVDTSGKAEASGVKVHVIQTGPLKAIGVPGAPVTPEQVAVVQEEVEDQVAGFYATVRAGRPRVDLGKVATGGVWIADKAKSLGLVDRVETFDRFVTRLEGAAASRRNAQRARADAWIAEAE